MDTDLDDLKPDERADELERRRYYRQMSTSQLAEEALSFSSSEEESNRALAELENRVAGDYWAVVLALTVNIDADDGFRYHLFRRASDADEVVACCARWLMLHGGRETFESAEYLFRVVADISEAKRAEVPRSRAMAALLSNVHLPEHLRAQAGLELAEDLGDGAYVLMHHHLGHDLVPALEELWRQGDLDAVEALKRISLDETVPSAIRLRAAQAASDASDFASDEPLAKLAVASGLTWAERLDALERAVDVAGSSAAKAALALLRAATVENSSLPTDQEVSDQLNAARIWG